ncbi:partitioning defective 3 homolog B isoform X6 [Tachysurus ichikawai]
MDRIQQLRREYQQARREGAAPAYEELEARRQGSEFDPHRLSSSGGTPDIPFVPKCPFVQSFQFNPVLDPALLPPLSWDTNQSRFSTPGLNQQDHLWHAFKHAQ